jgi:AcrR family transcriptional regulator
MAYVSRQERRHNETRAEILRAARKLVIESGAQTLSVREIARRTDFTPSALYRYFEDGRQEILLELARGSLAVLEAHLRRVPQDLPPDERIIEMGITYLQFARDHVQEITLLFDSITALEPFDADDADRELLVPTGVFELIVSALREGVEQGMFRIDEADLHLVMHGAWAYVHGLAQVEAMQEHHEELFGDRARDLLRAFVNGLRTEWTA